MCTNGDIKNTVVFRTHPSEPMPGSDEELEVKLTREHFKTEVRDAIVKGHIRHHLLVRKFVDEDSPYLTKAYVSEIVFEVQREMIADYADHNPQMELLGYLVQGDLVLENLNDLLDSNIEVKEKVAVMAAIQTHWEKRIGFLKFIGVFNKLKDPARPNASMLESGGKEDIQSNNYKELADEAAQYADIDAATEDSPTEEVVTTKEEKK